MNREIPVANRVIHKKDLQRNNDLHVNKIMSMKFSNLSSLKSKHEAKSAYKVKQVDLTKLLPIENRNRRVKTVMQDQRIREENKNLYNRLVNQKPTLSSKLFAEERNKNIQFLRRIGRYPYRPSSTTLDPLQEEEGGDNPALQRSHTFGELEEVSQLSSNMKISLSSLESMKYYHINSKIEEEQKKQHTILLWSKVIQLQKNWHTIKFLRFKNHYQIQVSPYPDHKVEYVIRLVEDVGTAMLSENDYDYEFIANKFIKFTHQTLCLTFQLKNDKKKHFYKFIRQSNPTDGTPPQGQDQPAPISPPVRKTVFALENDEREMKKAQPRPRFLTQEIEQSNLESDIVIELSKR